MTTATVITEGFGSFGSVALVVTDGFGAYGSGPTVIATILTEAFGTLTDRSPFVVTEGFGSAGFVPPLPPGPTPIISGGGRYLPPPGDYGTCKREIRALEKERKVIEEKIAKLEHKVDDKEEQLADASINALQGLIASLGKMQEQLAALRLKLLEIEEEEMMMAYYCINKVEWLQ